MRARTDRLGYRISAICAMLLVFHSVALASPQPRHRHSRHHHRSITPLLQAQYDFAQFSAAQLYAICSFWTSQNRQPIQVDDTMLTKLQAGILAKRGIRVIHEESLSADQFKGKDTYLFSYWLRPTSTKQLVSFTKIDDRGSDSGFMSLWKFHNDWRVLPLRTTPPPVGIEEAICAAAVWKPANGPLDIYIDHSDRLAKQVRLPYVHFHQQDEYRDQQWTSKAYLDFAIGSAHWLSHSKALVDYEYIYKSEKSDVSYEIWRTFLFHQVSAVWKEQDIGVAAGGE